MRKIIATLAAVLLLAGCGSGASGDAPAPAPATVTSAQPCEEDQPCWDCSTMGNRQCGPKTDPYKAYLAKAPKGEKTLSRGDASLRALLGCGQEWPPGTVDAVLAEAYAEFCPK